MRGPRVLQVLSGWGKAIVCKAHETKPKQLIFCFELIGQEALEPDLRIRGSHISNAYFNVSSIQEPLGSSQK